MHLFMTELSSSGDAVRWEDVNIQLLLSLDLENSRWTRDDAKLA